MAAADRTKATELLTRLSAGAAGAAAELMPLVYDQLRAQAAHQLAGKGPRLTLQPTALVHEAFVQLADKERVPWNGKTHFCAIAAKAMRDILVDHLRASNAQKRGGGWQRITLQGLAAASRDDDVDLVSLHQAMQRLATIDAEQAVLVELRFFGGLTLRDIEQHTGMPRSTVERRLTMAQAWLLREIDGGHR